MLVLLIIVGIACACLFGYCVLDTVNTAWETGDFFTLNTAKNVFTVILLVHFVWAWLRPAFEGAV